MFCNDKAFFTSAGSAAWHYMRYFGATRTCTTSLPLPLTSLCPWDYPQTGLYTSAFIVGLKWSGTQVRGGELARYCFCSSSLWGFWYSVLSCYYLLPWFADGFMRFSLMSSSLSWGANLEFRLFVPPVLFFYSYCSVRESFLLCFSFYFLVICIRIVQPCSIPVYCILYYGARGRPDIGLWATTL